MRTYLNNLTLANDKSSASVRSLVNEVQLLKEYIAP